MRCVTQFRRVDALPPYAIAEVERLKLELRRAGEDVIDFGFGNPDVAPPEIAVEKLREAAANKDAGKVREHMGEVQQRHGWLYRELAEHPGIATLLDELALWGF